MLPAVLSDRFLKSSANRIALMSLLHKYDKRPTMTNNHQHDPRLAITTTMSIMRPRTCCLCVIVLLVGLTSNRVEAGKALQKSWTLSHSNGSDAPKVRGTVQLTINDDDEQRVKLIMNEQDSSDMDSLLRDNAVFYQLTLQDNDNKKAPVIKTSVLACQLLRANLRDELTLMFGRSGSVISMSYSPIVSALAPPTCDDGLELRDGASFATNIDYELDKPGAQLPAVLPNMKPPPGLNFLPGSSKSNTGGGGGGGTADGKGGFKQEPEQPTSLFGYLTKYWYVVAPLLLMNFLAEPPKEEEKGGDGGSGGDAGNNASRAQAAVPAPAAAPARASQGGRSRRGKRG